MSENHSFSQAPYQNNLAGNLLKLVFIGTEGALLILSGLFILYGIAYQKVDQDKLKSCPHSLKVKSHSFKKGLFLIGRSFYNKSAPFSFIPH